jgi:hypothetical protein
MRRMALRQPDIGDGEAMPFARRPDVPLAQVVDCDAGADACPKWEAASC